MWPVRHAEKTSPPRLGGEAAEPEERRLRWLCDAEVGMENGNSSGRLRLTLRVRQRGESERELGTEYWRFFCGCR